MSEESKEPLSDALSETFGLASILREARKQDKGEREKGYWILCSSCGSRVVKKQFVKNGCYVCGWKQGHDRKETHQYRTFCTGCGRKVITKELLEKGCFVCGWRPR